MTRRADFCRQVWPDMGALYGAPGMGAVCLALQAEFDVDVPFLLFMALADAAGEGMDRSSRERLQAAAGQWRALAVVPLRGLRRALKELAATPAEEAFRQAIKAAELDAERLEVAKLAALFAPLSGPSGLAEAYLTDLGVPSIRKEVSLAAIRRALAAPDLSTRAY